jgi:hypothetical protein
LYNSNVYLDGIAIRNPVLERLTGQTNRYNGLRNESYYKVNLKNINILFFKLNSIYINNRPLTKLQLC